MTDPHNRAAAEAVKKAIPKYNPLSVSARRKAAGVAGEPAVAPLRSAARAVSPRRTVPFPADAPWAAGSAALATDGGDAHGVERAMLDELLGPAIRTSSSVPRPHRASSGSTDMELLTSMAAQLSKAEAAARQYREALVAKDKEIFGLKRELAALQTASGDGPTMAAELRSLRDDNESLKLQIHDMETFLNDYGLVWVGPGGSSSASIPVPSTDPTAFTVSFALVEAKVKMLNGIGGEGRAKVQEVGGAHRLVMPEGIPLTVYRNGFMLRRGPFRPYSEPANQAFMNDILDGYFPLEFKAGYPDGVIFELRDKSGEDYSAEKFTAFAGSGQAVGAPPKPKTLADLGNPELSLDPKEFLQALPKSVIRNGNVIEIRSNVAQMLHGATPDERPDVFVVPTPVVEGMVDGDGRPMTPRDTTTLQVKSDGGKQRLIIKLRYDDTIADVRKYIDDHRMMEGEYELRTAIPNKCYDDPAQTLRDAGLIPNAILMIRVKS